MNYQYFLFIGLSQKIFNHYYNNFKSLFYGPQLPQICQQEEDMLFLSTCITLADMQKKKDLDSICEIYSQQPQEIKK